MADSLFQDNPTPTNGSWIDNLLANYLPPDTSAPLSPIEQQMMTMTGPNQPISGLAPTPAAVPPTVANANAQAPQNDPIQYGNVSVPRIGSGFPDDEDAPAAATPRPAPALAPQPAQPQENPLLRMAHGLHSIGQGGTIFGAVTGNYDDPRSLQQAQMQKLIDARVAAGQPLKRATIAVLSPDAAKTIDAEDFGHDDFQVVQTGENGVGGKSFQLFNKHSGELKPIGGSSASAASGDGPGDMSLTGDAYIKSLPKQLQAVVVPMLENRQPVPLGNTASKPFWQSAIIAANHIDSTFDQTSWPARVAGAKDFASGKSSEMVRSANQTLHHTGQLLKSADDLNNGSYPLVNWAGNAANEAMGGGAPTAFRINAHAVAEEMSKVFKGANLSDSEIKSWESNLSENMSPAQQRAAVGKLRDLLQGSLQALDEKRVASIGQAAADKAGPIIKPEGQKVLQQLDAWLAKGNAAGASGTAPTGVKWSVVQ